MYFLQTRYKVKRFKYKFQRRKFLFGVVKLIKNANPNKY